jgi:hypothetical protein
VEILRSCAVGGPGCSGLRISDDLALRSEDAEYSRTAETLPYVVKPSPDQLKKAEGRKLGQNRAVPSHTVGAFEPDEPWSGTEGFGLIPPPASPLPGVGRHRLIALP